MMGLAVQHQVDRLAAQMGRPALLEDHCLRLVVYSAHDDPVDSVRETSILRRHASVEVSRWLGDFGVREARGPIRVPANADLDMLPRVCVPVRHRDVLLGFLWFIDAEQPLSSAEVDSCVEGADELGVLIHRESLDGDTSPARVAAVMRNLLSDSPDAATAAQELADDGLLRTDAGIAAAVARVITNGGEWAAQDGVIEAVLNSPRFYRRGSALHLDTTDHTALVLATSGHDHTQVRTQLTALQAAIAAELSEADPEATVVIGLGGRRADLASAYESYMEAQMAAMVAAALPSFGTVVEWSMLGVYQVAARLAATGGDDLNVHRGLLPLFDSPEALPLLETLETYLDAAGNAQYTAEVLHLHRTSLYYRLQRVERLAETDLKDGMERLALHLALKVARLTGRYGTGRDVPDAVLRPLPSVG